MVGQGVLRECLLDPGVESVPVVGRSTTGHEQAKLNEIVRPDLFDLSAIEGELSGYDACFFCLGGSSAGMGEAEYRHLTYDLTLSVARSLAKASPGMMFLYVSGAGTDSTASGRMMWARVKGATENALLRMPFKAAYMFRPGYIQLVHGARTRTKWYAIVYAVLAPLYPLWEALVPKYVTSTERLGRAMIRVARAGNPDRVLESVDINRVAG
jgi:uncharacterized protein YbjT (DUF2867 family)